MPAPKSLLKTILEGAKKFAMNPHATSISWMAKGTKNWNNLGARIAKISEDSGKKRLGKELAKYGWTAFDIGKQYAQGTLSPIKTALNIGHSGKDMLTHLFSPGYGTSKHISLDSTFGRWLAGYEGQVRRAAAYRKLYGSGKASAIARGIGDTAHSVGTLVLPVGIGASALQAFAPNVFNAEDKHPTIKSITEATKSVAGTLPTIFHYLHTPVSSAAETSKNILVDNWLQWAKENPTQVARDIITPTARKINAITPDMIFEGPINDIIVNGIDASFKQKPQATAKKNTKNIFEDAFRILW